MTETIVGAPALVTELDEERHRYESWLEQLEARRGTTPDHVYARVRDDYRQRLQGVVDRLADHAEALRTAVTELEQRARELREEEQRVQDDRAEGELRALVGEYEPERWKQIQAESDAALADLGGRRSEAEEELDRLRQLLSLAVSGTSRAADAGTGSVAPATSGPDARVAQPTPAPVDSLGVDSLGDVPVVPVEGASAVPVVPAPGGEGRGEDTLDRWSRELDDVAAPITRASRDEPAVDGGTTAIKTLRCQECGTMNYPTEWYCERCGGELATM